MNISSSRTRKHVFEAAVLLAALVLPGAAIYLSRMDAELTQSRERLQELTRSQNEYFKVAYLDMARQVEASVNELQAEMTNTICLGASNSFGFRLQAARSAKWVEEQMNRPQWEQIQNPKLMVEIARQQPAGTNPPPRISADLASLLKEVDRSLKDYMTAATNALVKAESAARRGDRPDPEAALREISAPAQQLLALAAEARQSATAIDAFLKSQKPFRPPSYLARYLLLVGLLGLFGFLILAFRCFVTSQLQMELVRREMDLVRSDLQLEHQQQLSHFGQLAAGLAHEIRNPLTAISARVYTLQKTLSPGTAEHRDSQVIRDEVQRLDRIVQDFLRLARPAEPKLVPMSAEALLPQLCELLAPQYEAQGIELKVESKEKVRFRADQGQIRQVLINLVRNSAESMERGGTITLRSRTDKALLRGQDSAVVVIEVEDNGSGIPSEVQERLFTPFFSTKESGTGLGLAIAARIVNKHGGELKFETKLDHGTTFRVLLPRYDTDL